MIVNQDSNCFCTIKYMIQIFHTQCTQLQEPELKLEKKVTNSPHKYSDVQRNYHSFGPLIKKSESTAQSYACRCLNTALTLDSLLSCCTSSTFHRKAVFSASYTCWVSALFLCLLTWLVVD